MGTVILGGKCLKKLNCIFEKLITVLKSLSSKGKTTRCDTLMCRLYCSMYLKRFKCKAKIVGNFLMRIRLWASCRVLQESHWNLLSLHKVSVLLKFLKQLVMDVFCSTSMLKSKKSSSLLVTVSQFKQRVSLVKMPWKISLIQVGFRWSLLESALEFLLGLPLT